MRYFNKELEQQFVTSVKSDLRRDGKGRNLESYFRQATPRTDNAYLNQLALDQDIFKGLLPELINTLTN